MVRVELTAWVVRVGHVIAEWLEFIVANDEARVRFSDGAYIKVLRPTSPPAKPMQNIRGLIAFCGIRTRAPESTATLT